MGNNQIAERERNENDVAILDSSWRKYERFAMRLECVRWTVNVSVG